MRLVYEVKVGQESSSGQEKDPANIVTVEANKKIAKQDTDFFSKSGPWNHSTLGLNMAIQ